MSGKECSPALVVAYDEADIVTTPEPSGESCSNHTAFRYKAIDGLHPERFAIYEMNAIDDIGSRDVVGSTYTLVSCYSKPNIRPADIPATFIYVVTADVRPEADAVFRAWYGTEHIPQFMQVAGWLRVRWYKYHRPRLTGPTTVKEGGSDPKDAIPSHKYLAIHELNNAEFADTSEYVALSRSTRVAEMKKILERVGVRVFELQR
ncbi:hypothetical protein C8R43DRAFT_1007572 [Mycena crocata]|nr:hypothetical protein C8R43DRAFT_1007572 [Mycena crocata]